MTVKKQVTIEEATKRWVREWNMIPQEVIIKAYYKHEFGEDVTHLTFTEPTEEEEYDGNVLSYGELPMWGTMFTFGESFDDDWTRENLDVFRNHGIHVYETDELGIFFGINGAGYDFYESHWIPLYKDRGLKWHTEE